MGGGGVGMGAPISCWLLAGAFHGHTHRLVSAAVCQVRRGQARPGRGVSLGRPPPSPSPPAPASPSHHQALTRLTAVAIAARSRTATAGVAARTDAGPPETATTSRTCARYTVRNVGVDTLGDGAAVGGWPAAGPARTAATQTASRTAPEPRRTRNIMASATNMSSLHVRPRCRLRFVCDTGPGRRQRVRSREERGTGAPRPLRPGGPTSRTRTMGTRMWQ